VRETVIKTLEDFTKWYTRTKSRGQQWAQRALTT